MLILCTFCAAQNRLFKQKFIPKRSQNWVIFAKNAKIVLRFFSETSVQSHKFLHLTPAPHFENFSLNTLNSEQKPSAKNRLTGPVKNRSTGNDFEIYRSGRVEKILTGSISGTEYVFLGRRPERIDLGKCCFICPPLVVKYSLYTPTGTVVWKLIIHVAFLLSRQCIVVGSGKKLVDWVENVWFHSGKTLFPADFICFSN